MKTQTPNFQKEKDVMNMRKPMLAVFAAAAGMLLLAGSAHATTKCTFTVQKEVAKFVQGASQTLAKCEEAILKDNPDFSSPPGQLCDDVEGKTSEKFDGAKAKMIEKIEKACCGSDQTCGTTDDQLGAFRYGRCPGAVGPSLPNPATPCSSIMINDASDVADCVACLAEEHVQEMVELHYASFDTAADPGSDEGKCQQTTGKELNKFAKAVSKSLQKCQQNVGKGSFPLFCPESDPQDKTQIALDKAESKKLSAICKKCGGEDQACETRQCTNNSPNPPNGDACELDADCNVCTAGIRAGQPCASAAFCSECDGASPVPGQSCSSSADCTPGTCISRTCGGGVCEAVAGDDLPLASIGIPADCPPILAANPDTTLDDIQDYLDCVDNRTRDHVDCTDWIGSTTLAAFPGKCKDTPTDCSPTTGPVTKRVLVTLGDLDGAQVGGIVLAVGYKNANLAGLSEIAGPHLKLCIEGGGGSGGTPCFDDSDCTAPDLCPTSPVTAVAAAGQSVANDLDDTVILSAANSNPILPTLRGDNQLWSIDFVGCAGAEFSCLVVDASDTNGEQLAGGVSCSIVDP
jgi:hypothetical protein